MLETKTLKVANSAEESTISLMQQFGWSLLSSQDVNNTDSHLENRNGSIYSVADKNPNRTRFSGVSHA